MFPELSAILCEREVREPALERPGDHYFGTDALVWPA
jgi:hypothetical protein